MKALLSREMLKMRFARATVRDGNLRNSSLSEARRITRYLSSGNFITRLFALSAT